MAKSGTPEQESMGSVMRNYADWIELQGFAQGSATDHRHKLSAYFKFLGDRGETVTQADADTIAAYQTHIFELVSPKTKKRLSCNTQINLLSYLRNFYRFLSETGRIAADPTRTLKLPREPKLLPPVILKPNEMRRLLAAPDLESPLGYRDRVMMEVFYASGIRLNELLCLAIGDLDAEKALIDIQEGKGGKQRLVPMGEACSNWLTTYLEEVRPLLIKKTKTNLVFLNRFGRAVSGSGWTRKLHAYLAAARIEKLFTTHCFRHQLATNMLQRGADTRHIQKLLGHDNLQTTQRYLQVVKAELKRIHRKTHPRGGA